MRIADPLLAELNAEAAATQRVLERVPAAQLEWRPHAKSSSLGQLALHVATIPRQISEFLAGDSIDFASRDPRQKTPASREEVLSAFNGSIAAARQFLGGLDDERAGEQWRLMAGERELFAAPRAVVLRSFLFNHWYHHRGQLLVYLRLLEVPVPSVYGPTADENPFVSQHGA